jgi:hypothetical protein
VKRRARSFVRARARAARNSSERVLRRPDTRGAVRERRGRARSVLVMTRAVDGFATRPDFGRRGASDLFGSSSAPRTLFCAAFGRSPVCDPRRFAESRVVLTRLPPTFEVSFRGRGEGSRRWRRVPSAAHPRARPGTERHPRVSAGTRACAEVGPRESPRLPLPLSRISGSRGKSVTSGVRRG